MAAGDEAVAAYCAQRRIAVPAPRDDGSYVLFFDRKYAIRLQPRGRDGLLLACDLPALTRDRERAEAVAKLLRVNLALFGRKRATLALEDAGNVPFLYDQATVDPGELAPTFRAITGFVNDVALFNKALAAAR